MSNKALKSAPEKGYRTKTALWKQLNCARAQTFETFFLSDKSAEIYEPSLAIFYLTTTLHGSQKVL